MMKPDLSKHCQLFGFGIPSWRPLRHGRTRAGGFTLVELLVVIAIVMVLAVIAFTASKSVSRAAKASKAISNLRQTGILVATYSSENHSRIPCSIDWGAFAGNPPGLWYFHRILAESAGYEYGQPPQTATRPLPAFFYDPCIETKTPPQHPMGSFGVNVAILPDADTCAMRYGSKIGVPVTSITDPARKVICCSVIEPNWSSGWAFDGKVFAQAGFDPTSGPQPRNGGGCASLFADGHVEKLDIKSMDLGTRQRYFTP